MAAYRTWKGIYYGWFVVAACVFVSMTGNGAYNGFGVFIIPMSDEFGWSRAQVSFAASLGTLLGGFSQPIFGWVFDRIGGRRLILWGLAAFGFSTVLLAFTNGILYLTLVFGVLMALAGSAGTFNTGVALVSKWFHRRRATAVAIVSAGGSLSGMIFVPFVAFLIPVIEWRGAWTVLGAITLCLAVPTAFLILRDEPPDTDAAANGGGDARRARPTEQGPLVARRWQDALRSAPFWQISAGYFVCGVTTSLISTHFVPYAVEEGFTAAQGALAFSLLSGLNVVGVMGAGLLGDRWGRKNVLGAVYLTRAVAFAVLLTAPGLWGLFGFAIVSGFSWFGTVPLTTALTAEVYGLRNLGALSGLVYLAHAVGGSMSVYLAGKLNDVRGDYDLPLAGCAILLLAAAAASFAIREKRYSTRWAMVGG